MGRKCGEGRLTNRLEYGAVVKREKNMHGTVLDSTEYRVRNA